MLEDGLAVPPFGLRFLNDSKPWGITEYVLLCYDQGLSPQIPSLRSLQEGPSCFVSWRVSVTRVSKYDQVLHPTCAYQVISYRFDGAGFQTRVLPDSCAYKSLQIAEESWSCCDIPCQTLPAPDFKKEINKLCFFSSLASPVGILSNWTDNRTRIIIIKHSHIDIIHFSLNLFFFCFVLNSLLNWAEHVFFSPSSSPLSLLKTRKS